METPGFGQCFNMLKILYLFFLDKLVNATEKSPEKSIGDEEEEKSNEPSRKHIQSIKATPLYWYLEHVIIWLMQLAFTALKMT